jgi:hypothetical protein
VAHRATWRVATQRHRKSIEVTLVDCACQGVASHKLSTLVTISFTRPSDVTSYMKMRICSIYMKMRICSIQGSLTL